MDMTIISFFLHIGKIYFICIYMNIINIMTNAAFLRTLYKEAFTKTEQASIS